MVDNQMWQAEFHVERVGVKAKMNLRYLKTNAAAITMKILIEEFKTQKFALSFNNS